METRLFDASESYEERDAEPLLGFKNKFGVDYVHSASDAPCWVLPGDVVPYHMPDTVVFGDTDNVAVIVDLINRAGGVRRDPDRSLRGGYTRLQRRS